MELPCRKIIVRADQEAEIYATVMREMPKIERAVLRIFKQLKDLEGVSQKQAIASVVTHWILAIYPNDPKMALLLSEHMREQVDVHIGAAMGIEQRH